MHSCEVLLGHVTYRGADKSLARPGKVQARKHVRDARDFNETRAVIKFFFSLQGKAPKEIDAVLTETVSFLVGLRTYQHPCMRERALLTRGLWLDRLIYSPSGAANTLWASQETFRSLLNPNVRHRDQKSPPFVLIRSQIIQSTSSGPIFNFLQHAF